MRSLPSQPPQPPVHQQHPDPRLSQQLVLDRMEHLVKTPCPRCGIVPYETASVAIAYDRAFNLSGDVDDFKTEIQPLRWIRNTGEIECYGCGESFKFPKHLRKAVATEPVTTEPVAKEPVVKRNPVKRSVANSGKNTVKKAANSKAKSKRKSTTTIPDTAPEYVTTMSADQLEFVKAVYRRAKTNGFGFTVRKEAYQTLAEYLPAVGKYDLDLKELAAYQNRFPNCTREHINKILLRDGCWREANAECLEHTLSESLSRDTAAPPPTEPPISYKEVAERIGPYLKLGTCSVVYVKKLIASGELKRVASGRVDPASVQAFIKAKSN